MNVDFARTSLPDLPAPGDTPEIPDRVYRERAARLDAAREAAGLDAILVYADREHAANLQWLTGFSPRFEEALLVLTPGGATLLAGNECLGLASFANRLEARLALYQPFSLPDQDRSRSPSLESLLRLAGLGRNPRCGVVGWKPMRALEVPHFIMRAVQDVTGREPVNAAHLIMDAGTGLRTALEPEMIAFCEHAARVTSRSVLRVVRALEPGLKEREAAGLLDGAGLELACHPMVNFARVIANGLTSPRNRAVEPGGYAQVAFGVIGSLTCRHGRTVSGPGELENDEDAYLEIVTNYLQTVRAWYASLRAGATGGEVFRAARAAMNDRWDLALNPGHLIHLDEWVSSPFWDGSEVTLRSGAAVQQDIIPAPRQGNAGVNMEDGLVIADEDLRARLDPALLERCAARRAFMESIGYELHEDVLPLSDIAGAYFPFMLDPGVVARFA